MASRCVLFIFQLPAMSGVLMWFPSSIGWLLRRSSECCDTRQFLALEELERRSPAGGQVRDRIGHPEACQGRRRVAATRHGERALGGCFGNGRSNAFRPGRELGNLEDTHRSVPQRGASSEDGRGELAGGVGTDV